MFGHIKEDKKGSLSGYLNLLDLSFLFCKIKIVLPTTLSVV